LAKRLDGPVVAAVLTAAMTPTLFVCPLKHIGDSAKVKREFQGLSEVVSVTTGAPPASA
jgi:hypothetical protein